MLSEKQRSISDGVSTLSSAQGSQYRRDRKLNKVFQISFPIAFTERVEEFAKKAKPICLD